MSKFIIFGLILLVILVGGFYIFNNDSEEQLPAAAVTGETPKTPDAVKPAADATVRYSNSGFSPSVINVKVGTTVTFINDSAQQMWVASAYHPTHQALPGFDQLKWVGNNGTYQYTFTKAGDWKYHNHLNPKDFGTVSVK